jgi:hypothetical protein
MSDRRIPAIRDVGAHAPGRRQVARLAMLRARRLAADAVGAEPCAALGGAAARRAEGLLASVGRRRVRTGVDARTATSFSARPPGAAPAAPAGLAVPTTRAAVARSHRPIAAAGVRPRAHVHLGPVTVGCAPAAPVESAREAARTRSSVGAAERAVADLRRVAAARGHGDPRRRRRERCPDTTGHGVPSGDGPWPSWRCRVSR